MGHGLRHRRQVPPPPSSRPAPAVAHHERHLDAARRPAPHRLRHDRRWRRPAMQPRPCTRLRLDVHLAGRVHGRRGDSPGCQVHQALPGRPRPASTTT